MRRFLKFIPIALFVPLAACFDVEMTADFTDDDTVEMTMVMNASAEFYAMASSSGEDLCEDGDGAVQDDGSYLCTEVESGSIDEIMSNSDMGDGIVMERRDGGLIYVAFDLGDLTEDLAPVGEEEGGEEMVAMMREAFVGHAITINVRGKEIVETNGELSDDGTETSFTIALESLLDPGFELPETFNALLVPGS